MPQEPDAKELARLKALGKSIATRRRGKLYAEIDFADTYTGTVESFNRRKKSGFIRRDDGEQVLLDQGCSGLSRYKNIEPGTPVRFQACRFGGTWSVLRILSLGDPSK